MANWRSGGLSLSLDGVDKYLEKMQSAGLEIDKLAEEAVVEITKTVHEDMKEWTEKHGISGLITPKVERDGNYTYSTLGIEGEGGGWKAVFVEFGTKARFTGKGYRRGQIVADPGIRPAFEKGRKLMRTVPRRILKAKLKERGIELDK